MNKKTVNSRKEQKRPSCKPSCCMWGP